MDNWRDHRDILKAWMERDINARVPEVFYRADFYQAADEISPRYLASSMYPDQWEDMIEEIWEEWELA